MRAIERSEHRVPGASGLKARDNPWAIVPGLQLLALFPSMTQGVALGWLGAGASPLKNHPGAALDGYERKVGAVEELKRALLHRAFSGEL